MLREYIEFVQRALEGVDQWFVDMGAFVRAFAESGRDDERR